MAEPGGKSLDGGESEKGLRERMDLAVLKLARLPGFEEAYKKAVESMKSVQNVGVFLQNYTADARGIFDDIHGFGRGLMRNVFIESFLGHFEDGVIGDVDAINVANYFFGQIFWDENAEDWGPAVDELRREVHSATDPEKEARVREFTEAVRLALNSKDGWRRTILQRDILGRGNMQLREYLSEYSIQLLIAALKGLQQRFGFAIDDEAFYLPFFQVFLAELNQNEDGTPIDDPKEIELCTNRAGLIWREIFQEEREDLPVKPLPPPPSPPVAPPPPPVRSALPDVVRDLDALGENNEQKALAIRDSIESKKSAWEALFKFWNGDVSPRLLELPATCELRTALSAVLIGLGYTEETEELKLVMNRALQLLPMVGPGMDPSNPFGFLQTIDAWVRKLYKEILEDILRKRELQPLVRVDDSLGTPPPPPPVRTAEPGERLDSGALDVRDAQNAGTISKFIESKKSAWEALFKESKDESNPNLSGSSGYQKLRAELRDLLINLGYDEDPGRLIAVMDRVIQLFRLYPNNPIPAELALDNFVCNLLSRMVRGIFRDGELKAVARVERQRLVPLLFQAGGPRDPALPEGMPQPFRIEKVVSSAKLGASADPHEFYALGNVYAMTHIGVKTEGKKFRQEDRAGVTVFKTKEGRVVTRLSIADGMGGVEDGELAADLAVDALGQPVPYLEAEKTVREELKKREAKEAGACVVSVDICGSIAHLHRRGDARLYHFNRKGKCVWMSTDECRATQVRDYDLPLEEGALRQNARGEDADGRRLNSVTNDLSVHHENKALDVLEPRFLMPGDFLLLCSDGLSDTMGNFEIFSGLHRGTLLKDLLARMNAGQGKADNVVVILYEMPLTQGDSILAPQKITESLNP